MQIVKTIVWVLLLAALLVFCAFNWNPVEVKIWEGLVVETKIPALVVIALLIGLIPMWLIHRATKWQLKRRIASLESAAHAAATTLAATAPPPEPEPVAIVTEPVPDETKPLAP
jgi:putative membrane protein